MKKEIGAKNAAVLYKQTPKEAAQDYQLAQPSITATIVCIIGLFVEWLWLRSVMNGYYEWKDSQNNINININNNSITHTLTNNNNNTTITKIPDTSIVNAGIPIFLTAIAVEFIASLILKPELFRLSELVADMSTGLMQQLLEMFVNVGANMFGLSLIAMIPYSFIFDNFRIADIDGPLGWIGALLGRDLCYYIFHYASHRVGFLWAIHGVHHQPNEFNYGVNLSQGALQTIVSAPFYAPLALFFNPAIFAIVYPLSKIYGFFTHTRLVGKTYFLELFFVLPSAHRVHHAGAPSAYIDKNYGEVFAIWDRLFGTWQEETAPPVFGHVQPMSTWDPLEAQFVVWRKLYEKSQSCKTIGQKIWCFLGPPGWDPKTNEEYPLPDTTPFNAVKYDSRVSNVMTIYGGFHFMVSLVLGVVVLIGHKKFFPSYWSVLVVTVFVLLGVTSIGKLFDRYRRTVALETLRLVVALPLTVLFLLVDSQVITIGSLSSNSNSSSSVEFSREYLKQLLGVVADKTGVSHLLALTSFGSFTSSGYFTSIMVEPVEVVFVYLPLVVVILSLIVLYSHHREFSEKETASSWSRRVWIPEAGRSFGDLLSKSGIEYWKAGPVPDSLLMNESEKKKKAIKKNK